MSSAIEIDEVRRIAQLARLQLTDAECDRMAVDLSAILDYMTLLDQADTTGVEPTAHPLSATNVLRDDVPRESISSDVALANAPAKDAPYFKVPRVLDQAE
jgi:aspartyl-tRNA(Asn)/glutamyl-tRNA(Gln) amidotransferase subunit C